MGMGDELNRDARVFTTRRCSLRVRLVPRAADQYSSLFPSGEHADEMETSMGMAFFPELMKRRFRGAGSSGAGAV